MNIDELEKRLLQALQSPLPGEAAQYRMAPLARQRSSEINAQVRQKARKAAVLALFENYKGEAHLIVTRRRQYGGVHSGQISFPGGKREDEDSGFLDTALRETREEIGISSDKPKILSALTELYIPPSDFLVFPFLGIVSQQQDLVAQESEVYRIHRIPVSRILAPSSIRPSEVKISSGASMTVPAFVIDDLVIWGATAMILSEVTALLHS